MTNPAVSVIIPVYNGTNYLKEAIDSVLVQTFSDYELLVIDDGSTDGTWDLIQSYGSRLRCIHKPNGGVASALNLGIKEMKGRWFAWLSHDDLWLPDKLEKQVAFLEQNIQSSACYSDYYLVAPSGRMLSSQELPWYPREQAVWKLFEYQYINGSTILIDRNCFEKIGLFSEQLRYTQDAEMWWRLLEFFSIGRVPEMLGKSRTHPEVPGSINFELHCAEIKFIYKKVFSDLIAKGIFPVDIEITDARRMMAQTYEWFGDSTLNNPWYYDFADEQYGRSIVLWPSWKNPAMRKKLINKILLTLFPTNRYLKIKRMIASVFGGQQSSVYKFFQQVARLQRDTWRRVFLFRK